MKRARSFLLFFPTVCVLVACTSNNGDVSFASFVAASRTPASGQVFLALEDIDGQEVTVSVRVHDLTGIAGSDLVLEYDAVRLVFRSSLRGSLLEQGSARVVYNVSEEFPGRLRALITRSSGTASAGQDDPVLVFLSFKVVATGDTPVLFTGSALLDEQSVPLGQVTFFAGTFVGG